MHIMFLCEGRTRLAVSQRPQCVAPFKCATADCLEDSRSAGVSRLGELRCNSTRTTNRRSGDGVAVHGTVAVGFSASVLALQKGNLRNVLIQQIIRHAQSTKWKRRVKTEDLYLPGPLRRAEAAPVLLSAERGGENNVPVFMKTIHASRVYPSVLFCVHLKGKSSDYFVFRKVKIMSSNTFKLMHTTRGNNL